MAKLFPQKTRRATPILNYVARQSTYGKPNALPAVAVALSTVPQGLGEGGAYQSV
jgi:hypothetical protein